MKIKELKKEFEKKKVRYTQLAKEIYDKANEDGEVVKSGYVVYECKSLEYEDTYYEVFEYKLSKPNPFETGDFDMVELYPSNEAFGVWAWCCSNKEHLYKVMLDKFGVEFEI